MSVQIFVQGKLLGIEEFLASPVSGDPEFTFIGRSRWISLLSEVLPRALLSELGLSRILLGSSGGDQFVVVLPIEDRPRAEEFLSKAAEDVRALTGSTMTLTWAITENLGEWNIVRKRLNEEMQAKRGAPAAHVAPEWFAAFDAEPLSSDEYFSTEMGHRLRDAKNIGWSPDRPAMPRVDEGKYTWPLEAEADSVPLARHYAPNDEHNDVANTGVLARRATGRNVWGVLRGDVDNFRVRLRRLETIEEHLQLSITYKQFFAGELKVICSLPEYWQRVSILYSGGDDFAVYGSWDALLPLAREIQRLFHRFSEENLRELPGAEGKTITMAIALASEPGATLSSVFEDAGRKLEIAKSSDKDCLHALGRTLEWKQVSDASELKDDLTRLVAQFGASPEYIREMCGIYRESAQGSRRKSQRSTERPWRFHRRLNRILPTSRDRDFQKARNSVITDLVGKNPANVKLRPSGRVALEWARLATEEPSLQDNPQQDSSRP